MRIAWTRVCFSELLRMTGLVWSEGGALGRARNELLDLVLDSAAPLSFQFMLHKQQHSCLLPSLLVSSGLSFKLEIRCLW